MNTTTEAVAKVLKARKDDELTPPEDLKRIAKHFADVFFGRDPFAAGNHRQFMEACGWVLTEKGYH